jgi:hypothetical protein
VKTLLGNFTPLQIFLKYLHNSFQSSAKVVPWYAYLDLGKLYFHITSDDLGGHDCGPPFPMKIYSKRPRHQQGTAEEFQYEDQYS